jgi:8-oxo-dGTP pyrophosphatase MutT (NUDIX family)
MSEYILRLRQLVGGDELLQAPSVSIALRDEAGRVLLARHVDANGWVLPGGTVEPAETPADAAVREMWEETALFVRLTRMIGVFGGPDFVVRYRNGHRTSYVASVFEAALIEGSMRPDGAELQELRFVSLSEAESLPLSGWVPEVLQAVFGDGSQFRQPQWVPPRTDRRD